ncbi:efflux RND transporter periplasmic adaptor subunit [Paenibacillus sp. MMO-58]|uniref:efflux RND transporter periplasmic adaptor subunit n=1 Tax=Paenibacillus sp. MMO-58 TaxID=3081290 RepID=UPI0030158CA0
MKKWTLWLGIIIILAAAGGGAYYYYYMRDDKATTKTPLAVQARAIKGDIKTSISGTGSVEANSRETVTAGKSGTIATLSFKEGDKVKKGQVLATFEDNSNYDDQIETINKNITKTKSQIADKQEEYKQAIGTENEEQTTKSIKDEIDDLQSTIDDYNDQLQKIYEDQAKEVKQVIAPIDGEVTTSDISVGDEVQANTTIAEIVDYTHLEFVTGIDELDIPNVKLKQTAQITLSAITDHTIEATVSEIAKEGTSSNGSASYSVSLLLNDIDGVMVGMSGQADIVTEQSTDAVLVPVNAVVEFGGKSYVRVPGTGSGTGTGTGAAGSGAATGSQGGQQQGQRNQGTQGATGNEAAAAGGWQGRGGTGGGSGRFQGAGRGTTTAEGGQSTGRNIAAADGGNQSGTGTTPGGTAPGGGAAPGGAAQGTAPSGSGTNRGGTGQGNASGGNFPGGNGAAGGQGGRNGMANQMRESITLGGQLKEVTVGISNETYVEIKSGLAEGDTVLIPVATGAQGMGSSSTQQQQKQFGGFGGGGFGGNFPSGGFGGGVSFSGGGGNVRTSTRAATGGGGAR